MSSTLEQLGQVLVQSLWQGVILGLVLMVLLLFIKQPRARYILSCLTLFAMLGWFVMSWVQVSRPSVTPYTLENNHTLLEQPTPSTSTESVASTSNLNATQPLQPTTREVRQPLVNSSEQSEARAFPKLRLQDFLPYISVVWIVGVALLSLRLLVSFYLLKRYRKGSLELTEPWLLERMQILAKRLNLRQHITLLQTDALSMPAVMGVLKPLVLLPPSLVSGLSVGQLELILAHELAHIKRRDYLVNILQTLAETLLFYHPVVWWVSKVIRQEREHCCDDLALQVTGQSAVEYADILLRLEKSRQTLALAASGGSLLRRVERLLNPSKASADVRSGVVAFALVFALSLTLVVNAVTAQPIQVSKAPYVFNAKITVDQTNPERIVVATNSVNKYECNYALCYFDALLYTTEDGGSSWEEQSPVQDQLVSSVIQAEFDSSGELYTTIDVGFDGDSTVWTYVDRADPDLRVRANDETRLEGQTYNSKIAVHPETGVLYMTYLALKEATPSFDAGLPEMRTSSDGGKTWSEPVSILKKPTWELDGGYPMDLNLFFDEGEKLAVVWTQDDSMVVKDVFNGSIVSSGGDIMYSIWVALSNDGGKTFTSPRWIGESMGDVATAYLNGSYYIATKQLTFQSGQPEFEYRLLYSQTNGVSWTLANINRNVEVLSSFPYEVIPGLSVSPDNTLDVVFYAHTDKDCISLPAPYNSTWIDKCTYNVYHTYSKDNGTTLRTFVDPVRLNDKPISGSQFVQVYGRTRAGWFIDIASTNEAAYPVWIGNREGIEGTQAYMMRIER